MKYILENRNVRACGSPLEWARWFETADRTVAKTKIGASEVSTVFLGIDRSFGGSRPMLFETMVFGGPLDGEQDRYSTWDEAEVGHKRFVERITP